MKMTRSTWTVLVIVAVCFFSFTFPSYSADETAASSRQKFISVVNLAEESSANAVIQNNGVIEFQGNELVNSVAGKMAANGTLPPGSTLALPKDGRNMASDAQMTSMPLDLVEKDLQAGTNSKGIELDALIGNATNIARNTLGVPMSNIASVSVSGDLCIASGLGTGSSVNSPPSPPPQN